MRKRALGFFAISALLHALVLFNQKITLPAAVPNALPPPLQAQLLPLPAPPADNTTTRAAPPNKQTSTPSSVLTTPTNTTHDIHTPEQAQTEDTIPATTVVATNTARPTEIAPAPLPPAQELYYELRHENGSTLGFVRQRWQPSAHTYRLSLETATTGLLAWVKPIKHYAISEGERTANGLQPLHFRQYQQDQLRDEAHFDWKQQQLQLRDGQTLALPPNSQDILTLAWQLALTPTNQPIWVSNGRKLSAYTFDELARENILLDDQHTPTRHWRKRSQPHEEQLDIWISNEGIPVKLRHTDKRGFSTEQVLQRRANLTEPATLPAVNSPDTTAPRDAP